jgi:flagellar assembly factor FliW
VKINTKKFGQIEIDETKILSMPEGLPGFPGFERFVLLEDPKTLPFCWFQSIEEPFLALILTDPFIFKKDYALDLSGFIAARGWEGVQTEDLLIYVVVNISDGKAETRITANLMGPLVMNPKNNEVIQVVISDTDYSHQYNLLEPV